MLIGSRRLRWASFGFLAVAALCVFQPSRTWLEQVAVRQFVSPRLSVSAVNFHAAESLIQVDGLAWSDRSEHRPDIHFSGKQVWLVVESEPLLDYRFIIPKVMAHNVLLSMENPIHGTRVAPSLWREQLSRQVAELDWRELSSHFNSLLAADDLADTWSQRIAKWIEESQAFAASAEAIENEASQLDNPLRFDVQINADVMRLENISREQVTLRDRFSGIKKLLDSEKQQLIEKREQDRLKVLDLTRRQTADDELLHSAARELFDEAARASWLELAALAEVGERLTRAPQPSPPKYNYSLRASAMPVVEIGEVELDGLFAFQDARTPFQLVGRYREYQSSTRQRTAFQREGLQPEEPMGRTTTLCQFEFLPPDNRILLLISRRAEVPEVCDLQIEVQPRLETDADSVPAERVMRMVLASDGIEIDGMLTVMPNVLETKFGSCANRVVYASVTGTWQNPLFNPADEIPNWMLDNLRRQFEEAFEESQEVALREIDVHYGKCIGNLARVSETLVTTGMQSANQDQEVIHRSIANLHRLLTVPAAAEYARRNQPTQR